MNPLRSWKVVVSLMGIFGAGAVTGGVGAVTIIKRQVMKQPAPHMWPSTVRDRLETELELTDAQKEKLGSKMDKAVLDLRQLGAQTARDASRIIDRVLDEIEPELTDGQRQKLKEFKERRQQRMRGFMQNKGGHDPKVRPDMPRRPVIEDRGFGPSRPPVPPVPPGDPRRATPPP